MKNNSPKVNIVLFWCAGLELTIGLDLGCLTGPSLQPIEVGALIICILQMKTTGAKEAKLFHAGRAAGDREGVLPPERKFESL